MNRPFDPPPPARFARRFALALFALLVPAAVRAAQPWADERLPVREGLLMWLDASRQPVEAANGAPVAIWSDGSGNRRHALQVNRDARPVVVRPGDGTDGPAAVRFDGADDCLLI